MAVRTTRIVLDLDGEQAAVLRIVRALLKRLARDFGVRCRAVAVAPEEVVRS